jgi:hypothetical protein
MILVPYRNDGFCSKLGSKTEVIIKNETMARTKPLSGKAILNYEEIVGYQISDKNKADLNKLG